MMLMWVMWLVDFLGPMKVAWLIIGADFVLIAMGAWAEERPMLVQAHPKLGRVKAPQFPLLTLPRRKVKKGRG